MNVPVATALELVDNESVKTPRKVDFPAPDGPKMAVTLPSGNRISIACKICFPADVSTLSINAYPSRFDGWNVSEPACSGVACIDCRGGGQKKKRKKEKRVV